MSKSHVQSLWIKNIRMTIKTEQSSRLFFFVCICLCVCIYKCVFERIAVVVVVIVDINVNTEKKKFPSHVNNIYNIYS